MNVRIVFKLSGKFLGGGIFNQSSKMLEKKVRGACEYFLSLEIEQNSVESWS